jgi:hypothetical protein
MSTPEVRLVPAVPEHLDAWISIRAGATSRRLVAMDDDSRESLLKRLQESSSAWRVSWASAWRVCCAGTLSFKVAGWISRCGDCFTPSGDCKSKNSATSRWTSASAVEIQTPGLNANSGVTR